MTLGETIREKRTHRKLTIPAASAQIGLSERHWYRIESDEQHALTFMTAIQISRLLRIPLPKMAALMLANMHGHDARKKIV